VKANRAGLGPVVLVAAILMASCSQPATGTTAGSATNQAAGATVASAPSTIAPANAPVALASDATDADAIARASAVVRAVGGEIAAGAPTLVLHADPISGQAGVYVEIGDWEVAWTSRGILRLVFWQATTTGGDRLAAPDAVARVSQTVAALGLALPAPDALTYQDTVPDWSARWDRVIEGILAPGDGTDITLAPDGRFVSYVFAESATSPQPAVVLTEAQARAKFPGCRNSAAGAARTETCTADLVWYRPASAPLDQPLQLSWELRYNWREGDNSGGSSEVLDAGTGALIDSGAIS
jgi:hypothetical protein